MYCIHLKPFPFTLGGVFVNLAIFYYLCFEPCFMFSSSFTNHCCLVSFDICYLPFFYASKMIFVEVVDICNIF